MDSRAPRGPRGTQHRDRTAGRASDSRNGGRAEHPSYRDRRSKSPERGGYSRRDRDRDGDRGGRGGRIRDRSLSPGRQDRRDGRDRRGPERGARERDYRHREEDYDWRRRSRSRDRYDKNGARPRSRDRRSRSRDRVAKERSRERRRSVDRRSPTRDDDTRGRSPEGRLQKDVEMSDVKDKNKPESEFGSDVEVPDQDDIAAMMGFGGFGTTKGKKVRGNNVSGVYKTKKTEYRQYMNRIGGFNRALSPS